MSREEASKAQQALNNCVLGNTTICAESTTESDVHAILQHLGVPGTNNTNNNNNNINVSSGIVGVNNNGNNAQPWRPGTQQSVARTTGRKILVNLQQSDRKIDIVNFDIKILVSI